VGAGGAGANGDFYINPSRWIVGWRRAAGIHRVSGLLRCDWCPLAPAEPAQGRGGHDHLSAERARYTLDLSRLAREGEQAQSFVDPATCRCCGAANKSLIDATVAIRHESTETAETFLSRMELPKQTDAIGLNRERWL
jgi:hypothetical protein